jgi:hypothetical protein
MNELDRLHQEAMELVDRAMLCRRQGQLDTAIELIKAAFIQEQAASDLIAPNLELEPSRSVLHRSAANLAVECHEFRLAEKLITRALSGNPPADIAEELRDLLIHEIYPQRQLLA